MEREKTPVMTNEQRNELLDVLSSHEGTLIQLGAMIESHRLQCPNPNYLVTPIINLHEVELRLMNLRERKRELIEGKTTTDG